MGPEDGWLVSWLCVSHVYFAFRPHRFVVVVVVVVVGFLFFIQNPGDTPFVQIMRASHVIKGAASNLMCAELRKCAMQLETAASSAANDEKDLSDTVALQDVKDKFAELEAAVKKYHEYLESVGI